MWRFDLGGGVELYDARARMWSPKLGTFLSVDEFAFHDARSTVWGWPGQNAIRWRDPSGRIGMGDSASSDRAIGSSQSWGDPGFQTGMNQGAAAGAAATVAFVAAEPFVSTSAGIALWGTLSEMGTGGAVVAAVLSGGIAPAVVNSNAGQSSLPGQMAGDAALAGQCVEKTKQSIETFGGTPVSTLPNWSHWANQLPSGMIHDPTLRANLAMEGAYVGDVAVGQTMYTAAEWASLVARVGK